MPSGGFEVLDKAISPGIIKTGLETPKWTVCTPTGNFPNLYRSPELTPYSSFRSYLTVFGGIGLTDSDKLFPETIVIVF